MPWLPDFVNAVQLARRQTRSAGLADPLLQYVTALEHGDARALETVWPGTLVVHDPRAGKVTGHRQLTRFVRSSQRWLADHQARMETIATISDQTRAVVEVVARLTQGRDVLDWPVAMVAESPDDRSAVFRTYCSQVAVDGRHHVRPPLLDTPAPTVPAVVTRFLDGLAAGDTTAVVSTFAPSGCYRGPEENGNAHRGTGELEAFFLRQFSAGGGIRLEPCAVTDDGTRCAVEYNCTRWGGHALSPQAGIVVCERGPDGLLSAVRTYDDIESPVRLVEA